jgi:uncharacterized protein YwqG
MGEVPTEEEIRATVRPAIFLKPAVMPVPLDHPGRSYIGGLPRLPPDLAWPEKAWYREQLPLTFLAQVDLAELPLIESSGLPRAGTLYFFLNTNSDSPQSSDCRVLYYSGDATGLPVRDLPATLAPYGAGAQPWPWLAPDSVWARTNFRFPLEFVLHNTYRDYHLDGNGNSGLPPRSKEPFKDPDMDEFVRCYGPIQPEPLDVWGIFRRDLEEWPFAWVVIEYAARALIYATKEALEEKKAAPVASTYQRIIDIASTWMQRAVSEVPHARPDDATRAAFREQWRGLAQECVATSSSAKIYGPSSDAGDLLFILMAACYACASSGAVNVIPEIYRDALEKLGVNFTVHQMLGHGQLVQWAPILYADRVLLLQLTEDHRIGWHSIPGCVLQFWITPEALKQHAFDTVVVTLDCD